MIRVWRRTGQRSNPAFIVERHTAISQGVTVCNFLGHTIIFSGPSRHFDSSQIDDKRRLCYPCYQVAQVPFINRIMLVHILREIPTMSSRIDVLPWPARSPDLSPIEHVYAAIEIKLTAQMQSTMAGSFRGHK
ncbi:hypothetical protein TNCV_351971 [Trichonephila clavipes]|nr:hypothetical protein TNCV_351971 [Trichonephila clavipes]